MSYILDALKKSEAERSNRDHPEFAHRVPFEPALRKSAKSGPTCWCWHCWRTRWWLCT